MLPVWIGCGVMMLGISLCFYCNHERIWALVRTRDDGGCDVVLAASSFKWRERLKERFQAVLAALADDTSRQPEPSRRDLRDRERG
jgi:hypothetical protein